MKRKYVIDGLNVEFSSLQKAKDHFWSFSDSDKEKLSGTLIYGYLSGKLVSVCEFRFVNKKSRFKSLKY